MLRQTPFPAEVWLQILEHLETLFQTSTQLSVLKTCVFLRGVAEASLYVTVTVRGKRVATRLALLGRTLQCRPNLGAFVRHLKHDGVDKKKRDEVLRFPVPRLLAQFSALLPKLRTLSLRSFNIDPAFCAAVVRNWPQLHMLCLNKCSVAGDVLAGALAQSRITTLVVANPEYRDYNWDALVPAAQLHTLTIAAPIYVYMNHMLQTFFPVQTSHSFPELTALNIYGTHFTLPIHQLLVHTPNLRRISFRRLSPSDDQLTLDPDMIPHLEYFEGPARCMPVYVRGRPVHTVKIHTKDYWHMTPAQDFLRALGESKCPVTRLVLNDRPSIDIDPNLMMPHAPRSLETLGFDGMKPKDVMDCLAALPKLPVLRCVEMYDEESYGIAPAEKMLATLRHASFPELWEAVIQRRTWFRGDDDVWRKLKTGADVVAEEAARANNEGALKVMASLPVW